MLTSRTAFEDTFPGVDLQPIHGDAPYYNMIETPDGAYDDAAVQLGLRPTDARVLRMAEAAGRLGAVAALAMAPQLPMLVDALAPVLDLWRSTPPLTGL